MYLNNNVEGYEFTIVGPAKKPLKLTFTDKHLQAWSSDLECVWLASSLLPTVVSYPAVPTATLFSIITPFFSPPLKLTSASSNS